MSPKSDNVRCGYGSRLKPNRFLAHGKRKCLRTVGLKTGMLNCLAAYGVWRLQRDLALIKARLPRRRQLAGCVYMHRVTLLLAMLLLRSYLMHTLILANCLSEQTLAPQIITNSSDSYVLLVSESNRLSSTSDFAHMMKIKSKWSKISNVLNMKAKHLIQIFLTKWCFWVGLQIMIIFHINNLMFIFSIHQLIQSLK